MTDKERMNLEDGEGFTKKGIKNISYKEWIKGDKEKMEKETKKRWKKEQRKLERRRMLTDDKKEKKQNKRREEKDNW